MCCTKKRHGLPFHLPSGKLKTLMNSNNSFVLICLIIILCLNNVKKCFMIKCYIPYSENLYTFQKTKYYIKILYQFNKSCLNLLEVLRFNMASTLKK